LSTIPLVPGLPEFLAAFCVATSSKQPEKFSLSTQQVLMTDSVPGGVGGRILFGPL